MTIVSAMLRRLCTLILVLVCAFAPALPLISATGSSEDCGCCGNSCKCPPSECALPPVQTSSPTQPALATAAHGTTATKPAPQAAARGVCTPFVSVSKKDFAMPGRFHAERIAPAAGVALLHAHCSLLI
jgi:hypothetical protein